MINGMRVIYTDAATALGTDRLFPVSRHRSARIHKKLLKRFGGEFKREPAILSDGRMLYVHPVFKAELERQIPAAAPFPTGKPFERFATYRGCPRCGVVGGPVIGCLCSVT